jgi:hypothetical protein
MWFIETDAVMEHAARISQIPSGDREPIGGNLVIRLS